MTLSKGGVGRQVQGRDRPVFQDKMGYRPKESERDYIFLYVIFSGIFRNAGMDYIRNGILNHLVP